MARLAITPAISRLEMLIFSDLTISRKNIVIADVSIKIVRARLIRNSIW